MEEWEAGVVRWEWDADLRVVRGYGVGNILLGTRDYTVEENAAADAYIAFQAKEAEKAAIVTAAAAALPNIGTLLTDLDGLLATADGTINAAPATYIKQLADGLKEVAAVQEDVLRYVFDLFD